MIWAKSLFINRDTFKRYWLMQNPFFNFKLLSWNWRTLYVLFDRSNSKIRLFMKKFKLGVEDLGCPGFLSKVNVEILVVNIKRSRNSRGNQEKIMWKSHQCWFLVLDIPMSVTHFCESSSGETSICLEFPRVKWKF